jgi:hypothetical protein
MMFRRLVIFGFLILSIIAVAQKKSQFSMVKLPPKTVAIENLQIPHPKQPCPNWAWAVAVQLMLNRQNVMDITQSDWVLKAFSGELCVDVPVDLHMIKRVVDGNYILLDGRHVQLEAIVTDGAPTEVGYLVHSVETGMPLLVLWRGRPMVLQAIEYDESIYPNNQRMFEARKLTLVDPISGKSETFDKSKDDTAEIGGMLEVKVEEVKPLQ